MSEPIPATPTDPTAPEAAQESPQKSDTPPWGNDFKPEVAWDKIQKANREAANLRERAITPEQQKQLAEYQKLVEASKTEQERQSEAQANAVRERDAAIAEGLRYKIALRHNIAEEDFDLLGVGDEATVEARAQKIAAKNEAAKTAALNAAVTQPASPSPRRPVEDLRPGASPNVDPKDMWADNQYPAGWLSPTQRAAVQEARGQ